MSVRSLHALSGSGLSAFGVPPGPGTLPQRFLAVIVARYMAMLAAEAVPVSADLPVVSVLVDLLELGDVPVPMLLETVLSELTVDLDVADDDAAADDAAMVFSALELQDAPEHADPPVSPSAGAAAGAPVPFPGLPSN